MSSWQPENPEVLRKLYKISILTFTTLSLWDALPQWILRFCAGTLSGPNNNQSEPARAGKYPRVIMLTNRNSWSSEKLCKISIHSTYIHNFQISWLSGFWDSGGQSTWANQRGKLSGRCADNQGIWACSKRYIRFQYIHNDAVISLKYLSLTNLEVWSGNSSWRSRALILRLTIYSEIVSTSFQAPKDVIFSRLS